MMVIAVYVDNILLIGDDKHGLEGAKQYFQKHFITKDVGRTRYFLRIKVFSKEGVLCPSLLGCNKYSYRHMH